ncbi:MAG TPA: acyl-CoA-binding protein [Verrucomicrobiae bacterium]|nr:acyl-CoA-binding protein [Verrucomicrobiae bacterium]
MHRVEQGTFRHEGYTLAYEQHGSEDGVPILLMHGILLDAAVNRDLASPLADAGFRVILLDLLGHGRSDRAEAAELRNDFFAEQVVACLDHLEIDQAVVGGLSLGAIVSLQVAVTHPKRVKALLLEMPVMEESTPFAAVLLSPFIFMTNYMAWAYRPFAQLLRKLPRPRTGVYESALNAAAQDPEAIRAILHGVLVGPVVPTRRQRRRIQAPALVIGHKGDWLHNLEDAKALAEEIPSARLLIANSILELRTRPARLMPEILTFLRESTGANIVKLDPPSPAQTASPDELRARFDATVEKVRAAPGAGPMKPSNEMKLKMYALYRQATDGDVQGKRPGMMDVVNRFKFDAWATLQGTSREDAMRRYIAEVEAIEQKFAPAREA